MNSSGIFANNQRKYMNNLMIWLKIFALKRDIISNQV